MTHRITIHEELEPYHLVSSSILTLHHQVITHKLVFSNLTDAVDAAEEAYAADTDNSGTDDEEKHLTKLTPEETSLPPVIVKQTPGMMNVVENQNHLRII